MFPDTALKYPVPHPLPVYSTLYDFYHHHGFHYNYKNHGFEHSAGFGHAGHDHGHGGGHGLGPYNMDYLHH